MYVSDEITTKANFIRAADAFKNCSLPNEAALCYQVKPLIFIIIIIYLK